MAKRQRNKIPYTKRVNGDLYAAVPYKIGEKWMTKYRRIYDESIEGQLRVVNEVKQELGISGPGGFDGEKMTFADLMSNYRRAYPDKPACYTEIYEEFFGSRRIRSITYADCKQFQLERAKVPSQKTGEPRKIATINREMEQLRAIMFYALNHGWIKFNPCLAGPSLIFTADEERRDRVPTPAEEAAILAVCVPPRAHLRGLIIATRDTGLRRSALLSLTWNMVDWQNRLLRIPKPASGNKKRPSALGISARLFIELQQLWDASGFSQDGRIFNVCDDFKRAYKTACRLAGVEGLRFNDFRHGFSTDLMEAGVPEHLAMKIAGHTQASTHAIYTNVDDRLALQVAAALDRLHNARSSGESFPTEANEFVN